MKKIKDGVTYKKIYTKTIRKNGKTIRHPKGGVFVFWIEDK